MRWKTIFAHMEGRETSFVREIVLASRSPRRQALIQVLGIPVRVVEPPDAEEGVPGLLPMQVAMTLAARKIRWTLPLSPGSLAISADTVVVIDGEILGKPRTLDEARTFLQRLSGRWHQVYTGVALAWESRLRLFYEETAVRFHKIADPIIELYLQTGSSLDKAGGYGAQDLIGLLGIAEIRGDFYNVMGLPVQRIYQEGVRLLGREWVTEAVIPGAVTDNQGPIPTRL